MYYLTATRIPPSRFIWASGLSVDWSHLAELWTDLRVLVGRLGSISEAQGFAFRGLWASLGEFIFRSHSLVLKGQILRVLGAHWAQF